MTPANRQTTLHLGALFTSSPATSLVNATGRDDVLAASAGSFAWRRLPWHPARWANRQSHSAFLRSSTDQRRSPLIALPFSSGPGHHDSASCTGADRSWLHAPWPAASSTAGAACRAPSRPRRAIPRWYRIAGIRIAGIRSAWVDATLAVTSLEVLGYGHASAAYPTAGSGESMPLLGSRRSSLSTASTALLYRPRKKVRTTADSPPDFMAVIKLWGSDIIDLSGA